MKKAILSTNLFVVIVLLLAGCSGFESPDTDTILKAPFGSGGLNPGMTRSQVLERYGEPDLKSDVTSDAWKGTREEWYYCARYDSIPVNAGYLSQDLYLYFDGDNLTNTSKKELGEKKEIEKDVQEFIK